MSANIHFESENYSEQALRLILAKAQEWNCTPSEAVARLLDQLANRRSHPKAA